MKTIETKKVSQYSKQIEFRGSFYTLSYSEGDEHILLTCENPVKESDDAENDVTQIFLPFPVLAEIGDIHPNRWIKDAGPHIVVVDGTKSSISRPKSLEPGSEPKNSE